MHYTGALPGIDADARWVWDVERGSLLASFALSARPLYAMVVTPDGEVWAGGEARAFRTLALDELDAAVRASRPPVPGF